MGPVQASPSSASLDASEICYTNFSSNGETDFHIFKQDFSRVAGPFVICFWIFLASGSKIVFHFFGKLSNQVPESALLIVLGIPIGYVLNRIGVQQKDLYMTPDVFFLFLLPPIVLDAGYFIRVRQFFQNIRTILLHAVLGTVFNSFAVGGCLYACGLSKIFKREIYFLEALLFGCLLSSVDPVAVLAVFEELHVNEVLYIIVFGESLLNDAVTVVLYNTVNQLLGMNHITAKEIIYGFISFLVVSLGGVAVGIIWGFLTALVTKFTNKVRVIEPVFIFVMAYMAYLTAETFHLSGIMSVIFCGIVMRPYVEINVSRKSNTTIKYFLKMLSSTCETLIFMFLGTSIFVDIHEWDVYFIILTYIFISVFRVVSVTVLSAIANWMGPRKLGRAEQFIMCYGGLRGAITFSLAILISPSMCVRNMFVTTCMMVVTLTIFLQGITLKPLLRFLRVKTAQEKETTIWEQVNDQMMDQLVVGVEGIVGQHGFLYFRQWVENVHSRYLVRIFTSSKDEENTALLTVNKKLLYRDAMQLADNPNILLQSVKEAESVSMRRNHSYNSAVSLRFNRENNDEICVDMNVFRRDMRTPDNIEEPHRIFELPGQRYRRPMGGLKYSMAAIDEDDEAPGMRSRANAFSHGIPRHSSRQKLKSESDGISRKSHYRRKHKSQQSLFLTVPPAVQVPVSVSPTPTASTSTAAPLRSDTSSDEDLGMSMRAIASELQPVRSLALDNTPVKDIRSVAIRGERDAVVAAVEYTDDHHNRTHFDNDSDTWTASHPIA